MDQEYDVNVSELQTQTDQAYKFKIRIYHVNFVAVCVSHQEQRFVRIFYDKILENVNDTLKNDNGK